MLGRTTAWWKSVVKLLASLGRLLSCPGKGTVHPCGEGMRPVLGQGAGTLKMAFFIMLPWYLGEMCLKSIDSTFIFFHLEISASKEQLAVHFPFIDTL